MTYAMIDREDLKVLLYLAEEQWEEIKRVGFHTDDPSRPEAKEALAAGHEALQRRPL